MNQEHFCLVSVPKASCLDMGALRELCNGGKFSDCVFNAVSIPLLKFRNLDVLLEATEIISRKVPQMESYMHKILTVLQDVAGHSTSGKVTHTQSFTKYFDRFQWNESRYDLRDSLLCIAQGILRDTEEIEEAFQSKFLEYSECVNRLEVEKKKYTTNTAAIPMSYLVAEHSKKSALPFATDFLATLFIVVPAGQSKEWLSSYAELTEVGQILPNSSVVIFGDETNIIFSVMLLQKAVTGFRKACLLRKWIVRDPKHEEAIEEHSVENLQNAHEKLRAELVRLLHASIAEYGEAYTHLRVTECYVESILKYGLPADFLAFTVTCPGSKYKHVHNAICSAMRETNTAHPAEEELGEMGPFVEIDLFA